MAKKRKRSKGQGGVFGKSEHRPRLHLRGRTFKLGTHSPYKGRSWAMNPYLREVGMLVNPRHRRHHRRHSYRHNPLGGGPLGALTQTFKHPMASVMDGLTGALAMYMTIAIPNWILPFPGVDLMSKLLRLGTRVAAGGLIVSFFKQPAVRTGASIGALGGSVFDFLGTRIIVGQGDTGQTPLALLAPITGGMTAYTRPVLPSARGLNAYTRSILPSASGLTAAPAFPARSVVGHKLF